MKSPFIGRRIAVSFVLCASLVFTTMAPSCSKDQLLAAAKDVLSVVQDQAVIDAVAKLSPEAVSKLAGVAAKAKKLYDAIKASDKTTAGALVADIFPVIEDFAQDFHANDKILAILALANIALHLLLNHLPAGVSKVSTLGGNLNAMKSAPVWGCNYRPQDKRCIP